MNSRWPVDGPRVGDALKISDMKEPCFTCDVLTMPDFSLNASVSSNALRKAAWPLYAAPLPTLLYLTDIWFQSGFTAR